MPPQQRAWWADAVRNIEPFDSLPVELFERIIADVEDFPIDWDGACEIREALMAERGRIREEFEEALGQVSIVMRCLIGGRYANGRLEYFFLW